MYFTHKLLTGSSLIIPLLMSSCGKDNDFIPEDPAIAVLGKWETVQVGNWPHMEPYESGGFTEFRSDSTILFYDYEEDRYTNEGKYWLDDSLVFMGTRLEDGNFHGMRYWYEFLDKQTKFRIDYYEDVTATNKTEILKRIQ